MEIDINNFSVAAAMEIIKGLSTQTIDQVKIYADPKYSVEQMEQIRIGIDAGINVDIYADPKFSSEQMKQIRLGILDGVDVIRYAVEDIDADSMEIIRIAMSAVPEMVDIMFGEEYTASQLFEIFYGLIEKVDVSKYANPDYTSDQMRVIRESLLENWNVDIITYPKYGANVMTSIKNCSQLGFDIVEAVNYILDKEPEIAASGIVMIDKFICYAIDCVIYDLLIEDAGQAIDAEPFKTRMIRNLKTRYIMSFASDQERIITRITQDIRGMIKRQ